MRSEPKKVANSMCNSPRSEFGPHRLITPEYLSLILMYMQTTVVYKDFDFFGQNGAFQTGDRCKMGFWDTFI
jgi:hypothetical protein